MDGDLEEVDDELKKSKEKRRRWMGIWKKLKMSFKSLRKEKGWTESLKKRRRYMMMWMWKNLMMK
jgi:hypothetical protein